MREFFEIFNVRFWLFCAIAFSPLWSGVVAGTYLIIKEKITKRRGY